MTSPSRTSAYSGFFGSLFHVFPTQNEVLSGEQKKSPLVVWWWDGKIRPSWSPFVITRQAFLCQSVFLESISRVMVGWENPSLVITICQHSTSLVMPIGDLRDGFFYPTLTLLMDSYILRAPEYEFWIQVHVWSSSFYQALCICYKMVVLGYSLNSLHPKGPVTTISSSIQTPNVKIPTHVTGRKSRFENGDGL